jgi:hypothetical protein
MQTARPSPSLFRRHIALPTDHGSWVFLLSPLLIGLFAGGRWSAASAWLIGAAFAAFLIRQPVTMLVKAYSGRRSREEAPAALFWIAAYGLIGLAALAGLLANGYGYLLWLAVPAGPVFAWHLWLVSRRAERRQMGVELVGSGVLALAAPAAYWVGAGSAEANGWWLWLLAWLQSAASIVYAYLRLEQRVLTRAPGMAGRVRMGWRALLYCSANVLIVLGLGLAGIVPLALALPFGVQWAECVWGMLRPALGVKPVRIGLRQTIVSALFTLLFILLW